MSGINYDYSSSKSNSKEGEMAKKTLLSMARDLYNLYIHLKDEDDLPQWCHYKLAKSEDNLKTVTDYLINKITKHCLDNNISHNMLQKEVASSVRKDFINEGFFDVFSGSNKVSLDAIRNQITNVKEYKSLSFFVTIAESLRVQHLNLNQLSRLSQKDYQILIDNAEKVNNVNYVKKHCNKFSMERLDVSSLETALINTKSMIRILEKQLLDAKASLKDRDENLRFKSKTTSARKKKKGLLNRFKLFGESTVTQRLPDKKYFSILGKVLVVSSYFKYLEDKVSDETFIQYKNNFVLELMKYSKDKQVALNIIRAMEITIKESRKNIKKNEKLFQKKYKD
jgi:hypothetical protein